MTNEGPRESPRALRERALSAQNSIGCLLAPALRATAFAGRSVAGIRLRENRRRDCGHQRAQRKQDCDEFFHA